MATTDTRSGFRLPWSSDRSQDDPAPQELVSTETPVDVKPSVAWPETDFAARGFATAQQRPPEAMAAAGESDPGAGPDPAAEPDSGAAPDPGAPATPAPAAPTGQLPPTPPRKPTKLMADLAAAIRATADTARDQRLGQLDGDATAIVDMIRAQSDEGAVALRRQSDDDVSAIRDWAKAEIARIKEESEHRIADRKHLLEQEVADHAAAIEDRIAEVHSAVAGYRRAMDAYFERLQAEEDPARLATMAETMPEPPSLDGLMDLDGLEIHGAAARHTEAAEEPVQELTAVADEAPEAAADEMVAEAAAAEPVAASDEDAPVGSVEAEAVVEEAHEAELGAVEPEGEDEAAAPAAEMAGEFSADTNGSMPAPAGDDVPRWAAGETPNGFPEAVEGGDPVDRGAIMAALEAAAEAVVAAEAAAESAETAEAAADVAETAAELVAGRAGQLNDADPEAQAALSARVDAGGFETESYTDRLASLLPGHAEAAADGEPRVTQVVVTGLVSVASIASFKRHLGRLAGVTAVAVASGPDGEFIFNVTHRPDVSFRDAIPTMPGFAARVVATGDGVVSVTAHDPEAEG